MKTTNYELWTPKRILFFYISLFGIFFTLGLILLRNLFFISIICFILALLLFLLIIFILYARYLLSPKGKNWQELIINSIFKYIKIDKQKMKIIDIGCGNGLLTIKLAKKYFNSRIIGIDYWGKDWDYSLKACKNNAEEEGVIDRIEFKKASASKLPFKDEEFDLAVSNFVFHEVKDTKDKKLVIKEALRVVKKGGYFAFHDHFPRKKIYGDIHKLLEIIKSWGISDVNYKFTGDEDFLKNSFLYYIFKIKNGIIYGIK